MSRYTITAFTHEGTERTKNEDAILIGNKVFQDQIVGQFEMEEGCFFVADGVGGNIDGAFASRFVLEQIALIFNNDMDWNQNLNQINQNLLKINKRYQRSNSPASTLSGIEIKRNRFKIIHAGDSEIFLFRNGYLLKQTSDHVLDDLVENSPITSYFGGNHDSLKIEMKEKDSLEENEILFICSDGIKKALTTANLIEILNKNTPLLEKTTQILRGALEKGAIDNISAILLTPLKIESHE